MNYDIKKIVELSALRLDENEEDQLRQELDEIIDLVSSLPDISAADDITNFMEMRSDIPDIQEIPTEDLLSAAPENTGGFYTVPKTLEY